MMGVGYRGDESYDHFFYSRAVWQLTFAWLPHRCDQTNQLIWFKFAYCGAVTYRPGDLMTVVSEKKWMCRNEWLIEKIKGKI